MAYQFSVPGAPERRMLLVDTFLGVDLTSQAGSVDRIRSPWAPNMIRDMPGKVRKCMGWHTMRGADGEPYIFNGAINGCFTLRGASFSLVHAGDKIYKGKLADAAESFTLLYTGAANARSCAWQFDRRLYLLDGKVLLCYDADKDELAPVQGKWKDGEDVAYVPTLTIGKSPAGGGESYEALNLLQPKFTELFAGTATDKTFQMTFGELDDTPVTARKMTGEGVWTDLAEDIDFSVNRTTGAVTFVAAPGASPVTGEDNLSITAARTVGANEDNTAPAYADRVNHCRFGALFGVNGAADRLFIAGNTELCNQDWYSGQSDPTYWPDTGYSVLGTRASAIMGYSILNNLLATHKDDMEDGRNVIVRQGNLVEGEPAFPTVNTLQGAGAVAPFSFAYLGTEPLFLTKLGVFAITTSDISGERYAQNRSYYLNGKLLEEENPAEAVACVYKDLYWLCLNGVAYILDGLQATGSEKNAPYSTRQYAGFYRTNLPARVLWQQDERLCFGTQDGKIAFFYTDPTDTVSYSDDGAPIAACWETPDIAGTFYKQKTFRYLAVRLKAAVNSSVQLLGMEQGLWRLLWENDRKARYFSYAYLRYGSFTYSNDATNRTVPTKVRIRKTDKSRFRFFNDRLYEPFGLQGYACEYVENGNFKH